MKKLYTFALVAITMLMVSCSRESDEATGISDESLVSIIHQTDVLDLDANVSRTKARDFRIRMNGIAKGSFAGHGDMAVTYAVNSMLVKEYINNDGTVTGYDVMYKAPADHNSSGGWLWASYDAGGNPTYSVNLRGNSCTSGHSRSSSLVLDGK